MTPLPGTLPVLLEVVPAAAVVSSSAWASFVFLFLIAGLPSYLLRFRRLRKQRGRV